MNKIFERIKNFKINHKALVISLILTEIIGILVLIWLLRTPLYEKFIVTSPKAYDSSKMLAGKRYILFQNDSLVGKSKPDTKIKFYLGPLAQVSSTFTGTDGLWAYTFSPNLKPGIYRLVVAKFEGSKPITASYKINLKSRNLFSQLKDSFIKRVKNLIPKTFASEDCPEGEDCFSEQPVDNGAQPEFSDPIAEDTSILPREDTACTDDTCTPIICDPNAWGKSIIHNDETGENQSVDDLTGYCGDPEITSTFGEGTLLSFTSPQSSTQCEYGMIDDGAGNCIQYDGESSCAYKDMAFDGEKCVEINCDQEQYEPWAISYCAIPSCGDSAVKGVNFCRARAGANPQTQACPPGVLCAPPPGAVAPNAPYQTTTGQKNTRNIRNSQLGIRVNFTTTDPINKARLEDLGVGLLRVELGNANQRYLDGISTPEGLPYYWNKGFQVLFLYNPQSRPSRDEIRSRLTSLNNLVKSYNQPLWVEIGNEGDNTGFWNDGNTLEERLDNYAKFNKDVVEIANQIDPNVQLVYGSLDLQGVYRTPNAGTKDALYHAQMYVNALKKAGLDLSRYPFAVHAYHDLQEARECCISTMIASIDTDFSFWITEIGINNYESPDKLTEMIQWLSERPYVQKQFIHQFNGGSYWDTGPRGPIYDQLQSYILSSP